MNISAMAMVFIAALEKIKITCCWLLLLAAYCTVEIDVKHAAKVISQNSILKHVCCYVGTRILGLRQNNTNFCSFFAHFVIL